MDSQIRQMIIYQLIEKSTANLEMAIKRIQK